VAQERVERRLAAILAADVVGYSHLVEADEEEAIHTLRIYRATIDALVASHHGRVFGSAGDSVIAEFASPVEAVRCAVEIQREIEQQNVDLPEDRRMLFRIGINLGDIVVEGDNLLGDGVNVAARLEGLAEPGSICVRRAVRNQVRDKLPLVFEDLGEVEVKNITRPIRVFRVVLDAEVPRKRGTPTKKQSKTWKGPTVAATAVVLVALVTVAAWLRPWAPEVEPASMERMVFPLPDKPSIAVLPFTNMSNDPEQEYFADGMTEDLITDLSKISGLFVIARNSSFAYKGKPAKVRRVAEELGVRYVLEGSVRRAGDQVRINAQLIDATSGGHVWAERYDGDLQDVFDLQDRITRKIVTALAVELTEGQQAATAKRGTNNVEAYDLFKKGWALYRTDTPQGFIEAIPYFERAVTLDPDYGRAYAALASVYYVGNRRNWRRSFEVLPNFPKYPDDEAAFISRAFENLDKSLRTPNPLAYVLKSETLLHKPDHSEAMIAAERAIALDPNGPDGYVQMARVLTMVGQPEEAVALVEKAMRLNPYYPPSYIAVLGLAYFGLEDYERAASLTEQAIKLSPYLSPLPLIASLGYLDEKEKAAPVIANLRQQLNEHLPGYPATIRVLVHWRFPLFKHSADRERLKKGLRRAGIS
jgi:TolB-like protein/class 3 adenylate cyclase